MTDYKYYSAFYFFQGYKNVKPFLTHRQGGRLAGWIWPAGYSLWIPALEYKLELLPLTLEIMIAPPHPPLTAEYHMLTAEN